TAILPSRLHHVNNYLFILFRNCFPTTVESLTVNNRFAFIVNPVRDFLWPVYQRFHANDRARWLAIELVLPCWRHMLFNELVPVNSLRYLVIALWMEYLYRDLVVRKLVSNH